MTARRIALAVLACGVLTGCVSAANGSASTSGEATSFRLSGTLDMDYDPGYYSSDLSCVGSGGYSDIHEGAPVTVYDNGGQIIALGALGPGRRNSVEGTCRFKFEVSAVPAGKGFYQYEISHRGKLTVTEDEAAAGGLAATLGG